jgi:hypothetical protein
VARQAERRERYSTLERDGLLTGSQVSPEHEDRKDKQTEAQPVLVRQTWPSHGENAFLRWQSV